MIPSVTKILQSQSQGLSVRIVKYLHKKCIRPRKDNIWIKEPHFISDTLNGAKKNYFTFPADQLKKSKSETDKLATIELTEMR